MCFDNSSLLAYTRLLPPGISYADPSIGRVVTVATARRTGLGKELIQRSIAAIENLFGKQNITLSAQFYLKNFYESLGFSAVSDVYSEDGIDHIKMTRIAP
jgi:ElaA protein